MSLGEKLIEELEVKPLFNIGGIVITESIATTWGLLLLVFIICFLMTRNLRVDSPSKRQVAVEGFVTWLQNTAKGMLGGEEKAVKYAPYICTVMLFIALCDLAGIFETRVAEGLTLMKPPTKDLNIPLALALMSIVTVEMAGIREKGVGGWLKSFTQPIKFITPINILEVFIKPLSLCMRLFGNVFGAFIIMELLKLVLGLIVPVPFSLYFDIFDGLIQAYVFAFLTSIYIQEAVE